MFAKAQITLIHEGWKAENQVEPHPPPCQETRSLSPPPSNTNDESRQAGTPPPPTIRKMPEGWRKEKDEKAESNKRMETSWNMVGFVGWWKKII